MLVEIWKVRSGRIAAYEPANTEEYAAHAYDIPDDDWSYMKRFLAVKQGEVAPQRFYVFEPGAVRDFIEAEEMADAG